MRKNKVMLLSSSFQVLLGVVPITAFLPVIPVPKFYNFNVIPTRNERIRLKNWFQDMLSEAFTNDDSLLNSENKSDGQVDYGMTTTTNPGANKFEPRFNAFQKTAAAPITPRQLVGTKWSIKMYLAGIPDADPSNNLFGSRVNISSREDKRFGAGVTVPKDPTLTIEIELGEDGACCVSQTDFTTGTVGQWKLFDGNLLRIAMECEGYQRRVGVTGTLSKVYWSDEDEVTSSASSTYSIPPGTIYADAMVQYGAPGEFTLLTSPSNSQTAVDTLGLLRVEKKIGALGATSKMMPCGTFDASMISID